MCIYIPDIHPGSWLFFREFSSSSNCFFFHSAVTATAATVISAENGRLPRSIESNATANSCDSKISSWLATVKSICLGLVACENDLNDLLFEKGKAVIRLSTTCLLRRDNCKREISIVTSQSPFVVRNSVVENSLSSIYSLPQLAHISDSSISSSEESVQGKSKIFLATPVTMSTTLSEISKKSNHSNQSNSNKFKLTISPPPPPPISSSSSLQPPNQDYFNSQISSSPMSTRSINPSKILQSIFLRTSTPLFETHSNPKGLLNQNGFFASPFVQSKSFKEVKVNTFCDRPYRSLENRKSLISKAGIISNDKRICLSLYNLTRGDGFGGTLSSDSKNPANAFFNNSRSRGSLKETDVDSGLEIYHKLYKETNLDRYYKFNKYTYRTSSLNNLIYNSKPNQNLTVCAGLDEDILNHCARSGSVSKSSRSLYSRLCENAKTPAQLRVAKSITKLNIPTWLSAVEFMQSEKTSLKIPETCYTPDVRRNPKSKLVGIAKTIQAIHVSKRSQHIRDRLNVSLPSKKYSTNEPKLQPIIYSKARKCLMNSKNKTHNITRRPSNVELDIQTKLHELYTSFLSQFQDFGKSFHQMRNVPMIFENRDSKFCSRISCSKLISKMNSQYAFCSECLGMYCCENCRLDDFSIHRSICIQNVLKQWLTNLMNNLFDNQISILSEISKIGQENIGLGFVLWTIEKSQSNNILSKLLIYSLASDAQEMGISLDEDRIRKLEFLFVISLICDSKKSHPLVVWKYLPFDHPHNKLMNDLILQSPCVNKENKVVNNNREKRERLFDAIDKLLRYFNINIQEAYPGFYFHLVEYVTKGYWFPPQNIFAIDPRSESQIKIVIVPDQMPLQIPIG